MPSGKKKTASSPGSKNSTPAKAPTKSIISRPPSNTGGHLNMVMPTLIYKWLDENQYPRVSVDVLIPTFVSHEELSIKVVRGGRALQIMVILPKIFFDPERLKTQFRESNRPIDQSHHKWTAMSACVQGFISGHATYKIRTPYVIDLPIQVEQKFAENGVQIQFYENTSMACQQLGFPTGMLHVELIGTEKPQELDQSIAVKINGQSVTQMPYSSPNRFGNGIGPPPAAPNNFSGSWQNPGSFSGPQQTTPPNNFSSPPNFNTNFFKHTQEAQAQNVQQASPDYKDFAAWLHFQKAYGATMQSQPTVQQNYFPKGSPYTQPTVNVPNKWGSPKKAPATHPKPVMIPPEAKRFQDGQFLNSARSPNSQSIEDEFLDVGGDDCNL